jgi:hypothetical protein
VVNMSGQHVCVLRVRVPLSRRVGILASDMAHGAVRQGFDPGLQAFLREYTPVAAQTRCCCKAGCMCGSPPLLPNE